MTPVHRVGTVSLGDWLSNFSPFATDPQHAYLAPTPQISRLAPRSERLDPEDLRRSHASGVLGVNVGAAACRRIWWTPPPYGLLWVTRSRATKKMNARDWHSSYDPGVPTEIEFDRTPLSEWPARSAKQHPDHTALVFFNARWSFAELHEEVERMATALRSLGVEKGTRVAIQMPNIPQLVIAYFATLRLGGVVVLTNPLYQNITSRFVHSHDYLAMEQLHDLHATGEFDLVIVDTPPSRNAAPCETVSRSAISMAATGRRVAPVSIPSKPFATPSTPMS